MRNTFEQALQQLRSIADSESHKGRLFERLMKTFFLQDPVYKERFSQVWLWSEWADYQPGFDGQDTGIDLVAEERSGGYCALQCKCYAPGTRISKPLLDSFITAAARDPFSALLIVDTGDDWGPHASRTIDWLRLPCTVLRFGDLADRPFDWPDVSEPEKLVYRPEPFRLRPHQKTALQAVVEGFQEEDRGKLIMACGTGKTFTALRIAEEVVGRGGRVLYLVPSIALFSQAMREWATHKTVPHRYVGICSDTRAGRTSEDASLRELEIPVTTDLEKISGALREQQQEAMTVVFSTYHSLPIVALAQADGAPAFDIILCDEAHRTTGIDKPGDKTSPFVLVHDKEKIRAVKRLYMTATPRIYTAGARAKAESHNKEVFSMDDTATYGPELHRLPFSRAVQLDLLSDYKVVILALSEQHIDGVLQTHLATASGGSEINLTDAAKIVGCWQVLQNPENKSLDRGEVIPLRRAIAFTNTIRASKRLEKHWAGVVESAAGQLSEDYQASVLRCETRHVDGQHHALERKSRIEWLKSDTGTECRILSNARCLSEGIDVPALDAVLFMSPRKSQVDIVQSVGRVMRKAEHKTHGYIILPIAVPADADPAAALDSSDRFDVIWSVLRALRSHDDRFDAEINKIDLNRKPTDRIIIDDGGGDDKKNGVPTLPFPPLDLPPGVIFARIVDKCGDRKYWETWAKDVAEIFQRLVSRIETLLARLDHELLREWFGDFLEDLKGSINESISRDNAVEMMAQHLLTQPVFEALFEHYDFASSNPVAQALERMRKDFGDFGLENETRDLERFYESVRMRARGLDNSEARGRVLMELYEKFFSTALKKDADRLGIVYTPTEIVDFILASTNHVLQQEFGCSISDRDVHVLDPFTGTGTFLVRLLQSRLIRDADLPRKYRHELHANELVLLAYYIAAVHIEEAFHGCIGPENSYEPFDGIVFTDTFNLGTSQPWLSKYWLPDNSERVVRQQETPIQVIVGNPPWSAGQRSSADDNPNVDYPQLEQRIADTYARRSQATNKNSLYDYYKMAIRWASDRIGEKGVVAFVTNGSWLEGNVDAGVRACLVEEFSSIYVVNLRGHTWKGGERGRAEGGPVFGGGSSATVAIVILVRNPNASRNDCRILYHDIGDYLKREEKLTILRQAQSIAGIEDWQTITPDRHHDWIGQRNEAFQEFYPMGTKDAKAGRVDNAIFHLYSRGLATGRDAYIYNFSREACEENARRAVEDYLGALLELRERRHPDLTVKEIANRHASNIHWNQELENNLRQGKAVTYSPDNVWKVLYRPFVRQHCYVDYVLVLRKYQMDRIFPAADSDNRVICVPGIGSKKPFSVLMTDAMPDIQLMFNGQCFPRYRYPSPKRRFARPIEGLGSEHDRLNNISEKARKVFRAHYNDSTITRDAIFDYIYGVLHAPAYRARFANNLSKEFPRIPFAPDFWAFAEAGRQLADLHLGYETCRAYPLKLLHDHGEKLSGEHFRIGSRKMKWADDNRMTLIVNEHIRVAGIPPEAHGYQVNGRTPLEWFIDRYRVKQDGRSGIVNDPNGWFEDPEELIAAISRIVHVSVETVRIVADLPDLFIQ
ncbi:MAG: DEAD/DEAH box helicase family protein [Bacteroidetes bacterium]|nr:DEAD/DEAH box helicase family protein [Bacteroidota bacterium]